MLAPAQLLLQIDDADAVLLELLYIGVQLHLVHLLPSAHRGRLLHDDPLDRVVKLSINACLQGAAVRVALLERACGHVS